MTHPHHAILKEHFNYHLKSMGPYAPVFYPYPLAKAKMQNWLKAPKIVPEPEVPDIRPHDPCQEEISRAVHSQALLMRYGEISDKKDFVKVITPNTVKGTTKRSVQTQKTPVLKEKRTQTTVVFESSTPSVIIKDVLCPVHPDATDLIPNNNIYRLSYVGLRHIMCLTNRLDRAKRTASNAKDAMSRSIKWHISPLWRQYRRRVRHKSEKKLKNKTPPFVLNKTHHDLLHFFLEQYLVIGEKGLPVYIESDYKEPPQGGEAYTQHVLEQYEKKTPQYEEYQMFQKRQRAEDRHEWKDITSDSSDEELESPVIKVTNNKKKEKQVTLRRKRKAGVKAGCRSAQ